LVRGRWKLFFSRGHSERERWTIIDDDTYLQSITERNLEIAVQWFSQKTVLRFKSGLRPSERRPIFAFIV
jgi:hypothetical protein